MNVPKAIELAMSKVIRQYAEIGEGVTIRAWQSLAADGSWDPEKDRTFPLIDIRCGPSQTDENQSTLMVECSVIMATNTDDDKDHAFISAMYEAVQELCDTLFSQFRSDDEDESPLSDFLALVTEETGAGAFGFGGFTFGQGMPPADDAGLNMIGLTMVVHYSKAGF